MDLQALVDSKSDHETLHLGPGEFFGSLTINRPICIVGQGKSTWIGSRRSPTVAITAPAVTLRNLTVEITSSPDDVAIEAAPTTNPVLWDVSAVGKVVGVPGDNIRNSQDGKGGKPVSITFLPPPPMSEVTHSVPITASPRPVPGVDAGPPEASRPPDPVARPGASSRDPASITRSGPAASWPPLKRALTAILVVACVLSALYFVYSRATLEQQRQAKDQEAIRITKLEQELLALKRQVKEPASANPLKLKADEQTANAAKALDQLVQMASQGNAAAQFRIGIYYHWGDTGPWKVPWENSDTKAIEWLQKAARQGHEDAKTVLKQLGASW